MWKEEGILMARRAKEGLTVLDADGVSLDAGRDGMAARRMMRQRLRVPVPKDFRSEMKESGFAGPRTAAWFRRLRYEGLKDPYEHGR